jgi:predicted acyltransferase
VFLLLLGVSMALSSRRQRPVRIVRRAAVLFALGLVVNAAPAVFGGASLATTLGHLRIMGVLQRIAIADLIASLVVLWLPVAGQLAVAVILLGGYWALLAWVPVPHHPAGTLTPAVNLPGWVDRSVLGVSHMYPAGRGGYDPEGLVGCLPAAGGVMIGYYVGRLLRAPASRVFRFSALAAAGVAMVGVGLVWSHVLPVNKRLWTSSYVLVMSGLATLALAAAHVVFDNRRVLARAAGWPFRVLGANALVAYVGSELTGAAFGAAHHRMPGIPHAPFTYWVWQRWLDPLLGAWRGNLAWAAGVAVVWWVVAAVLWNRRILLRV